MPSSRGTAPLYIHSFGDDLLEVFLMLFVFFLGSLILWPLFCVVTVLFIPVTYICRRLVLLCCVSCTCGRYLLRCRCRVFATPTESLWITSEDRPLTYKELRLLRQDKESNNIDLERDVLMSNAAANTHEGSHAASDAIENRQVGEEDVPIVISPKKHIHRYISNSIHSLVVVVERSLDIEKLIHTIEQRITHLSKRDSDEKYFPKFSQCLVEIAGGALVWVDDSNYSLSKHIIRHTEPVHDVDDLQKLLESKAKLGLPVDAPLWQLVVATGYGSLGDTVLLWRFHGAMYDGVTIAKVLTYALTNPHNISFRAHCHYFLQNDHLVKFLLTGPMKFLYLLIKRRHKLCSPRASQRQKYSTAQQTAAYHMWSERTLDLPLLLKNKMLLNMTCNDLLLAMITGAAGRLHHSSEHPASSDSLLQDSKGVLVPFDLWANLKNRTTLPQGNHLLFMPCEISNIPEVVPRLWHTEHIFSSVKKCGDTKTQLYMMNWLHYLPFSRGACRSLHTYLQGHCSSLVTSFNGPKTVESIDGASIRDIMFFTCPPAGVEHSLNLISYSGTVKLTTLSTRQLPVEQVDSLVSDMSHQLNQINKMVFQRYFPDGLGASVCPRSQPQASRVFQEFMNKLMEIDSLTPGASSTVADGGNTNAHSAGDTHSRSDEGKTKLAGASEPVIRELVHDSVDSSVPQRTSNYSSPNLSLNYTHDNPTAGSSIVDINGALQLYDHELLITSSTSTSARLRRNHSQECRKSSVSRQNFGKSKSTSALADLGADDRLRVDRAAVSGRNVSQACMYSISENDNRDSPTS